MAKTVVTQIMFRRIEVTTGKNSDRSGAFNGLAFLRALLWCRITGFPCAIVIPVSEGLKQAGYTIQERADDLSLSPCYETMSLQIGSVGRDGVLVPFKANARHIRNVKQSVTDFIRPL